MPLCFKWPCRLLLAYGLFTLSLGAGAAEQEAGKMAKPAAAPTAEQRAEQRAEQLATQWDNILTNIVHQGLVDYSRARKSNAFKQFILQLHDFDSAELKNTMARKAHLINLYNALTVDLIVQHYPVNSIKRIGGWFSSPWDIKVTVANGQALTLNDIEHKMLRPMDDARIHFAINCASASCPKLRAEAYRAARINQQLDEQRTEFVNSPKGVQFSNGKLKISRIFRWFSEDWGGRSGVLTLLQRRHTQGKQFRRIDSYLQYDWSLNEAGARASDIMH